MQSKLVGIIDKLNSGLRILSEVDSKVLKRIKEGDFKQNIKWDECIRGMAHSVYDVSTKVVKSLYHGFCNSIDYIDLSNKEFTLAERKKIRDISIAMGNINSDSSEYGLPNISVDDTILSEQLWMKEQINDILEKENKLTTRYNKYSDLKDRNTLFLNSQGNRASNQQPHITGYQRENLHPRASQGIREIGLVPRLFDSGTNTKDMATTLQIPSTRHQYRMASNSGLNNS